MRRATYYTEAQRKAHEEGLAKSALRRARQRSRVPRALPGPAPLAPALLKRLAAAKQATLSRKATAMLQDARDAGGISAAETQRLIRLGAQFDPIAGEWRR